MGRGGGRRERDKDEGAKCCRQERELPGEGETGVAVVVARRGGDSSLRSE